MTEPKIVQKSPFVLDIKPGKYYWCACGLSNNQPYCNGSYKMTDSTHVVFEITEI